MREEADALWGERLKVESQQQALKYERRIQVRGSGHCHLLAIAVRLLSLMHSGPWQWALSLAGDYYLFVEFVEVHQG